MNIKDSFLPKFSVHRPITVLMTFMAILVVGFIAFTQIPVELMPDGYIPPFLGIWVPFAHGIKVLLLLSKCKGPGFLNELFYVGLKLKRWHCKLQCSLVRF